MRLRQLCSSAGEVKLFTAVAVLKESTAGGARAGGTRAGVAAVAAVVAF